MKQIKQIIFLLIIFISQTGWSQRKVFIDVFAGLNQSYIESRKQSNGLRYGVNMGLLFNVKMQISNELRFGVLYNEKGLYAGSGYPEKTLDLSYITLPIYYNIGISRSGYMKLYMGPEINILMSENRTAKEFGLEQNIEEFDVSFAFGFKNNISPTVFYSIGISAHYKIPFNNFNIVNFPLSLGLTI